MVDMRYADPSVCPGCRAPLPYGAATCPSCALPVRHPLAGQLFATLRHADEVVARLRTVSSAVPAPVAATPPPPPPPAPAVVRRTGLRLTTVPKVLLGLGALCLLVAAVTFLAVSWSMLGVGGRTMVLAGLTAATAGAALWLHRVRLRIAAEALAAVALGMVALDVAGAEAAGWFGATASALTILTGLVLTVTGTGFAALTRPRLVVPQVAAATGALLAGATAVVRAVDEPTWEQLWLGSDGWVLLLTAAALGVPGLVLRHRTLLLAGSAGAAVLMTAALTLPVLGEPVGLLTLVAVAATGAWTAVVALLPRSVRVVAIAPATVGALLLGGLTAVTATVAAARWLSLGAPLSSDVDVVVRGPDPVTAPLVTVPATVLVTALLAVSLAPRVRLGTWVRYGGLAAGLAVLPALASYDVPLLAVTATTLLVTVAAATLALTATSAGHRAGLGLVALGAGALAVVGALPSAALTALAATVGLSLAGALHLLSRSTNVARLGGVAMPPAAAVAIWTGAVVLDVDRSWTGLPVLLAVAALAVARPRPEVEVPAAVIAVPAVLVAVSGAEDVGGSLALHLAVAGCLAGAMALLHSSRRALLWPAAGLLLLSSWVRLADLEVTSPEPYTLPLALAVLGGGLWHLDRHPGAGTVGALLPGLLLATLPSLVWVLDDPFSVRALVLGAACLALTVAGAALRWSAPLSIGAAVGAIVVVRELAPYAGAWPQWVWIGLAGTLLTVVGITWERRLLELRTAVGMLGRLR
jgi:hypothetical protein